MPRPNTRNTSKKRKADETIDQPRKKPPASKKSKEDDDAPQKQDDQPIKSPKATPHATQCSERNTNDNAPPPEDRPQVNEDADQPAPRRPSKRSKHERNKKRDSSDDSSTDDEEHSSDMDTASSSPSDEEEEDEDEDEDDDEQAKEPPRKRTTRSSDRRRYDDFIVDDDSLDRIPPIIIIRQVNNKQTPPADPPSCWVPVKQDGNNGNELRVSLRRQRLPPSSKNGDNDNDADDEDGGKTSSSKTKVDITDRVNTLEDLIKLGETFVIKRNEDYSADMRKIKALVAPLKKLQQMVGMHDIKQAIVEHLLFLLSGLNDQNHMMHTVIYGPPGSGKTSIALILSEIYQALGYSNGKFKIVKRSDLVAGYLGQTTLKTQKAINDVLGGVLFIDEAYSLGDKEQRDSFSKEIIDCLTQNLSEQRSKFICIIAGYYDELQRCFFAVNPGLKRRFPFQYSISKYSAEHLAQILVVMLKQQDWTIASAASERTDAVANDVSTARESPVANDVSNATLESPACIASTSSTVPATNATTPTTDDTHNAVVAVVVELIKRHYSLFQHQGGDIETVVQRCKIAHAMRVFGKHQTAKRVLNADDIRKGFQLFVQFKRNKFSNNTSQHGGSSSSSTSGGARARVRTVGTLDKVVKSIDKVAQKQIRRNAAPKTNDNLSRRYLHEMKRDKLI